jgi:Tfp pilus assembly protein PilX
MSTLMKRRGSEQDGFVMVVTMLAMTIALIVAGIAISDTVTARRLTENDRRGEAAQQAADAGLQIAMYRANQMNLGTADFNTGLTGLANTLGCLVPVSVSGSVSALTTVKLGAQLACATRTTLPVPTPAPTPAWDYETLGNHTKFAAQFLPGGSGNVTGSTTSGHVALNPVIVSIGRDDNGTATTADDVFRRAEAILKPVDPFSMIEATGNLSFPGLVTTLNGDVRTNGNLSLGFLGTLVGANVLGSDGTLLRLANVQYGGSYSGLLSIPAPVHTSPTIDRDPVTISPSKVDCVVGAAIPGGAGSCPAASSYSSVTHKLTITSGQTVTLGPGDFVFCGVSTVPVSGFLGSTPGGTLNTSASAAAPTRVFIDSPTSARCTGASPSSTPLSLQGKLNTISTTPSAFQFYIAGNGTPGGSSAIIDASLGSTVLPAFFLYAPDTNVTMKTGAAFEGNIIGHDIAFSNVLATVYTQDLGLSTFPLSASIGVFSRKQYVQCTGVEPPATTPTKDC